MNNRTIAQYASRGSGKGIGRILVLTGARETGKKTLSRHLFPSHTYVNIADPVMRGDYARLTAAQWNLLYPMQSSMKCRNNPPSSKASNPCTTNFEPTYIAAPASSCSEKVKEPCWKVSGSSAVSLTPRTGAAGGLKRFSHRSSSSASLILFHPEVVGPFLLLPSISHGQRPCVALIYAMEGTRR